MNNESGQNPRKMLATRIAIADAAIEPIQRR
jgi:hypothetical protein